MVGSQPHGGRRSGRPTLSQSESPSGSGRLRTHGASDTIDEGHGSASRGSDRHRALAAVHRRVEESATACARSLRGPQRVVTGWDSDETRCAHVLCERFDDRVDGGDQLDVGHPPFLEGDALTALLGGDDNHERSRCRRAWSWCLRTGFNGDKRAGRSFVRLRLHVDVTAGAGSRRDKSENSPSTGPAGASASFTSDVRQRSDVPLGGGGCAPSRPARHCGTHISTVTGSDHKRMGSRDPRRCGMGSRSVPIGCQGRSS